MAEKISIQIALEGGQEIQRQLADISEEGQAAFNNIAKSAAQVGSFENFKPEEVTARLKKMGVQSVDEINKIQAALQAAIRLEKVTAGVGALERAFGRLGAVGAAAFNQIGIAVNKLGQSLTQALGPLAGVARALGPIGIAAGGVAAGSITLIKFANAAEETYKALSQLQRVSGASFENLSEIANTLRLGGTSVKDFANEFTNLSEKIRAAGQAKLIREADEETVKWQNDIDRVRQQFDSLARGGKAAFSPLVTQATKVQALLESLAKERTPEAQWSKLAEIFKNLSSDAERMALGKALGLSPQTIQTLSLGAAKLQEMADRAARLGLTLTELDRANLRSLVESQTQASALFDALKDKMGALVAPALVSFWQGFTQRIEQLVPAFEQLAATFGQFDFSSLGAAAADFLLVLGQIAVGLAAMISGQVSFVDVLSRLLQEAGSAMVQIAITIGMAVGQGIIQGMIEAIQSGIGMIWEFIKQALGFGGAPAGGDGGGTPGLAHGGMVGGRGTGTSDSNLAWVSRGEHIMPAWAVAQPGVLAFLEALRRSGGNLQGVLDGMGRFALGGLVPRPALAFAGGGPVGSMSNVTINFPGLQPITGLRASAAAVDELHRAAALAQVRSGGRKPSRYS